MGNFSIAAEWIRSAKGIVVLAGAGMGVDSGLPDFRGDKGFWRSYPPYEALGLNFAEVADPHHFDQDPAFGWGFYGHRLELYRKTLPHEGYKMLLAWGQRLGIEVFAVTSNVDGHFFRAGFPESHVYEVHGSIHHLQCSEPCTEEIWENKERVRLDLEKMRAEVLPRCPKCNRVSRPNILMFHDFHWIEKRSALQETRYEDFLFRHREHSLVAIEIGAGLAVPTIRRMTETLARRGAKTIRINPVEPAITPPNLSLRKGGLEALRLIDQVL